MAGALVFTALLYRKQARALDAQTAALKAQSADLELQKAAFEREDDWRREGRVRQTAGKARRVSMEAQIRSSWTNGDSSADVTLINGPDAVLSTLNRM